VDRVPGGIPIRVLIVDDHPAIRIGVTRMLTHPPGQFEVVGEADSSASAVEQARALAPDVVIMDVLLPELAAGATRAILSELPRTRVLAYSGREDTGLVLQMVAAGAAGYVLKGVDAEELRVALATVAAGRRYFSASLAGALADHFALVGATPRDAHRFALTHLEFRILGLIGDGLSNKAIAADLGVCLKTVENHHRRLMQKLDANADAALVKWGIALGVTHPLPAAPPAAATAA
jgi:DNA-binding NarL/FixJ family response regulator